MAQEAAPKQVLPWLLFGSGVVTGVGAMIAACLGAVVATGLLGGLTAVVALILTFVIALRQGQDVGDIQDGVDKLHVANERLLSLTLSIAEEDSTQDYSPAEVAVADEDDSPNATAEMQSEALQILQSRGSSLTQDTARWRQKIPDPPSRGNHGWFVESTEGEPAERWFVRKANGWTIRKAMPRLFLDALEAQRGVNPQTIRRDFQLKEHGLAAWYARTYAGDLWKVWVSNRNRGQGIQTKVATEDAEPDQPQ